MLEFLDDVKGYSARKKTPFIMQMEAVECGAAALSMILAYHGRYVPLAQLRQECGVSRDGSKAANVLKAARRYGLSAKGYSKGITKLKEIDMPCIVFWEFNHFIVVEGISEKFVYVNDPAHGHRRLSHETFSQGFTGVTLAFEPNDQFIKKGNEPKVWPILLQYTSGVRKALIFVTICSLLATLPGIGSAALTQVLLDSVIGKGKFDWLRPLLSSMVLLMLFQFLLAELSGMFYRKMQMGISAKMHSKFFRHLLDLPYHFYSQRFVGDVVGRTSLVDSVVGFITGQITGTLVGLITMTLFGIVLFAYNPVLTLVGISASIVNFIFLRVVAKKRVEANIVIAKDSGKVGAITMAAITSIDTIKASGMEDSLYEKWAGYYTAVSNGSLKLELATRFFSVLPTLTSAVVNSVTLILGGVYVMSGEMSLGELMAYNVLMGQFLAPVQSLLGLSVQMQQIKGNLIRLQDVMDHPTADQLIIQSHKNRSLNIEGNNSIKNISEAGENPKNDINSKTRLDGKVEFKSINFGYSPIEEPLIADFSLQIQAGNRVAFVGKSGCGKSTLAKLATGLLLPWSGQILYDDCIMEEVEKELIFNSIGSIEQDLSFFSGTVRQNLTLWDDTIPDEWIYDACEDAEILEAILSMPGELDAKIAEAGGNFSGGQRQRLEIARTLVRKPSVMVLDEATSALDTKTEEIIMSNIQRRGTTCIIVAHRLSTVKNCHSIVVIDKGNIVEQGNHKELSASGGEFSSLVKHSSKNV